MLSSIDKESLAKSITEAERNTSAELVAVVAPASDHYSDFCILYSLMIGTLAAAGLWLYQSTTEFSLLLATQLGAMAFFFLVSPLKRLCIRVVPKPIRHHRAAHRAFEEYLRISQHVSATTPIVLFYVSLAERYVHILPSRLVREKIPGTEWEEIVREFTSLLPKSGLQNASLHATRRITALLVSHFPQTGEAHHFHHPVIETDRG